MGAMNPECAARRSRENEWPRIRADIDAGRLAMVGLVRHTGLNPFHLTQSHQVLAFAYEVAGDAVTIRIYDPNWPGRDDVTVTITCECSSGFRDEVVPPVERRGFGELRSLSWLSWQSPLLPGSTKRWLPRRSISPSLPESSKAGGPMSPM